MNSQVSGSRDPWYVSQEYLLLDVMKIDLMVSGEIIIMAGNYNGRCFVDVSF